MTRVARFVALAAVAAGFTACSNPTAPKSLECDEASCSNVNFVNPNVNFVNPNV